MAVLKSWKLRIAFLLTLCVFGVIYFGYFYCTGASCPFRRGNNIPTFKTNYQAYFSGKYFQNKFTEDDLAKDYNIDLDNEDVIVFLHIQKTGGSTFGKQLVQNLEVHPPCHCYKRVKKHCDCLNKKKKIWLFSRFSTGWRCGVHADWTELTSCVEDWFRKTYGKKERRYHYITMVRDPVARFISEWMHVRRGATWKTATLKCNGKAATLQEVPFCYEGENWKGVSLDEFIDCPHNLAFNRQTRMLANLTVVNCYNMSAMSPARRGALMLASAKRNLQRMAFFGLVEFQAYTRFLFEQTLNMNFLHEFVQNNRTHSSQLNLTGDEVKRIGELNQLDIELYQFAKDLFLQRVKQAYAEQGLPVPEELQQLIAQQAVEQQRETERGRAKSFEQIPQPQTEDLNDSIAEKDPDLTGKIFLSEKVDDTHADNQKGLTIAQPDQGDRSDQHGPQLDLKDTKSGKRFDHPGSPADGSDAISTRHVHDRVRLRSRYRN